VETVRGGTESAIATCYDADACGSATTWTSTSELVDERDRRTSLEEPGDVRLGLGAAAVGTDHRPRLEGARPFLRRRSPVWFDVTDDDVDVDALVARQQRIATQIASATTNPATALTAIVLR
jgi:hypothetical protein